MFVAFSPDGCTSGRVFADLRRYPKLVGGSTWPSTASSVAFYERTLEFDHAPTSTSRTVSGTSARPRRRSWPSLPRRRTATSTSRSPTSLPRSPNAPHRCVQGDRGVEQPTVQPHPPPGVAVGGHCIPVYPRLLLANDPGALVAAAARAANESVPARCVARLGAMLGGLEGHASSCSAPPTVGTSRRPRSRVFFPWPRSSSRRGRPARARSALQRRRTTSSLGFPPYHLGAAWTRDRADGPRDVPDARPARSARRTRPARRSTHHLRGLVARHSLRDHRRRRLSGAITSYWPMSAGRATVRWSLADPRDSSRRGGRRRRRSTRREA